MRAAQPPADHDSASPGPCTPEPLSNATPKPPSSTRATLEPPGSPTPGPCSLEPPSSPTPEPAGSTAPGCCTSQPPGSTRALEPPESTPVGPCTPEPPGSATLEPPESTPVGSCTPEPPGSATLEPPESTPVGSCTPEPPGSATLEPPESTPTGSCTLEPPGSATLEPPESIPMGPCTPEPPGSATLEPSGSATLQPPESIPVGSCTPEPPGSTRALEPPESIPVGSCTPEPPGSTRALEPPESIPVGSCTPELPGSATLEPPESTPTGSCTPEPPGSATLQPPESTPAGPCTPELPGNATSEPPGSPSTVSCTPRPHGRTPLGSPGSTTPASCTLGPPGTSSTPQEAPFHGWRVAPADLSCSPTTPTDLSCSPTAPEPLHSDGDAGPPPCKGSSRGSASPTTSPPGQDPPGPSPTKAGGLEPAGPEPAATSVPSPELAPGAVSWVMPLVWLEKSLNASSLLESLRHSLPLPTLQQDVGTSITPVPAVATGTFMTPRDLLERSTNTSAEGPACAKDSAAETDSLLWHCPREQLKSLPRAELEGRLESTLIIIEALSLQLRDWQENQRPLPGVGPAEQRDALTQTDVTHPKGEEEIYRNLYVELRRKTEALQRQRVVEQDLKQELERATEGTSAWVEQCLLFRGLVDAGFQSLQDDRGALARERDQVRSLVSRCGAVLQSVPGKLRSCLEERDAMRQRADEALRAKEEGDRFLEAFRSHASTQISMREQSLASQRELGTLLAETINQQASLAAESQPFREFIDVAFESLREERRVLDEERDQVRSLVSRCKAMLQSVPGKLQSCLEERDTMRQQADEALQAKEEASRQLEETSVALQDSVAQVEQLMVANSRLSADLSSQMKELASLQQERDALRQENEDYREEMAWLARERDTLQQERDGLCQELREMTECREFIDQENRMSRTQLMEAEAKLKSTLAVLRERSLQHEELKDSHQCLQEEQAALCKELESAKAELLDLQLKRAKVSQCSADIAESKMRLQDLADCLRAALQEEDDSAPSRSRAWTPAPRTPGWRTPGWQTPRSTWTPACRTPACRTPYRAGDSFVGSILKAASGRDADEATGGGSAFTRVEPASTPKRIEPEDGLLESVRELRATVSDLAALSSRIQELEQSEFEALQTEISNLQLRLEMVTAESQEKTDAQAATIAKLNKALRGKLQNEKELQDVVKQQEEKMLQLIDKSGEVTRLKGEVSQLKRSLQRAETEAKVLWEELRGQEPKVDAACVQERVLLRQEVDKLRLLLLEKEDENSLLSNKYLEQIRALELRLCHAQKGLRSHEEMQEKMREVLSSIPDVAAGCQEHHSLLRYLGLKPASSSRDSVDLL
ncbi:sperm-associated antigen 5 isoform X2 [Struthio camelus]|uniref:sperm-associated antigen 5 isoform X2 n=1 Tax=Struthio camelus TaxID=8801 RepID=UPI003603CA4A